MNKLIASLESLNRYDPYAEFTMSANSSSTVPHVSLSAKMRDTGNRVFKGYGRYVLFDDVLRLCVVSADEQKP